MPHYEPPERLNLADHFLDARVREGRGDASGAPHRCRHPELSRRAGAVESHGEPAGRARRRARGARRHRAARRSRVRRRVLRHAARSARVVVMVNPGLPAADVARFLDYTRARAIVTHRDTAAAFREAARSARARAHGAGRGRAGVRVRARAAPSRVRDLPLAPRRPRDLAVLGRHHRPAQGGGADPPRVRLHHRVLRARRDRATPRATSRCRCRSSTSATRPGSNLLFPFAAGASAVLFPEPVHAGVGVRAHPPASGPPC